MRDDETKLANLSHMRQEVSKWGSRADSSRPLLLQGEAVYLEVMTMATYYCPRGCGKKQVFNRGPFKPPSR